MTNFSQLKEREKVFGQKSAILLFNCIQDMIENMSFSNASDMPFIVTETDSYAAVYKPAHIHTVPLSSNPSEQTLYDWFRALRPHSANVRGVLEREGGILHRLDYETRGLVLIAKTQAAFDAISRQQELGLFRKTYTAESEGKATVPPAGFPPAPSLTKVNAPFVIESAFRPFGPGRKSVRPALFPFPKHKDMALDHGSYYQTEVIEKIEESEKIIFRIRIKRGFRHQIRCHLAWIGFPLLNDLLYSGAPYTADERLALTATAFEFNDPETGEPISVF